MLLIRLLIIGDAGVGKTSVLVRYNEDHFLPNQKTTIGVDYKAKEITVNEELIKLQVSRKSTPRHVYCTTLSHRVMKSDVKNQSPHHIKSHQITSNKGANVH
jgi:hypothetical protein